MAEHETRDIEHVELMYVGVFPAREGDLPVDAGMLHEIVMADEAIGEQITKRLKFGSHDEEQTLTIPGMPVLGRPMNLRTEGRGKRTRLYGDLVGVPVKLAKLLDLGAWPDRSVELEFDYEGPDGETYPVVLTGLALLGEIPPAIAGMDPVPESIESVDDVLSLYEASRIEPPGKAAVPIYFSAAREGGLPKQTLSSRWASAYYRAKAEAEAMTDTKTVELDRGGVCDALELPHDCDDSAIINEIGALKHKSKGVRKGLAAKVCQELGLEDGATHEEIVAAIQNYREAADVVDETKAKAEEAETEAAELSRRVKDLEDREAKRLAAAEIDAAIDQTRIPSDARPIWLEKAEADLEGTKTILASLPPRVDFSTRGKVTTKAGKADLSRYEPTEGQTRVAAQLGGYDPKTGKWDRERRASLMRANAEQEGVTLSDEDLGLKNED